MSTSKFLAKALGLYLFILSTAMLSNMPQFVASINMLIVNEPAMFVAGFITLIIGILLVVAHNFWQWHWRLLVTILAWLTLIKGIILLNYPDLIQHMTISYVESASFAYSGAGLDLLIALVLIYFGFKKD